jgi:hypothetical protein
MGDHAVQGRDALKDVYVVQRAENRSLKCDGARYGMLERPCCIVIATCPIY